MSSTVRCGLGSRLAAIVYDALVLVAVLFFATVPIVLLHGGAVEHSPLFNGYLVLVAFAFFGGFWTHGGQTIGMRTWHIRLARSTGERVRWRDAALRFLAAIISWAALGAGFWWCLVDREGRAWHDRLSDTELRRTS